MSLTLEELRSLVQYDPTTGEFLWQNSGRRAGGSNGRGYVYLTVRGKKYRAHRLAWFYVYGIWPSQQLDHINRDRADNRIENLRECEAYQNSQNRRPTPGIYWDSTNNKWRARIKLKGQRICLGRFESHDDARQAYQQARKQIHPFAQAV